VFLKLKNVKNIFLKPAFEHYFRGVDENTFITKTVAYFLNIFLKRNF